MQEDDRDAALPPAGWSAPPAVVAQYVQRTLADAVYIANQALNTPSEQAVMQIFQTMIDRTAFQTAPPTITPEITH